MKLFFSFRAFFFVVLLCFFAEQAKSQTFLLGNGYGVHLYQLDAFNQVIDRYNQAHVLDAEMPSLGYYLDGYSFRFALGKTWLFTYGFSGASKKREAMYSVEGESYRRSLRLRIKSYSLGLGYLFPLTDKIALYLGVEGAADRLKVEGRIYSPGFRKPEWDVVEADWNFSAGPSLMLLLGKPFGLTINPYYNYSFTTASAESLDQGLNGSAHLPPLADYSVNLDHYGLRLLFSFQTH